MWARCVAASPDASPRPVFPGAGGECGLNFGPSVATLGQWGSLSVLHLVVGGWHWSPPSNETWVVPSGPLDGTWDSGETAAMQNGLSQAASRLAHVPVLGLAVSCVPLLAFLT